MQKNKKGMNIKQESKGFVANAQIEALVKGVQERTIEKKTDKKEMRR